MVLVPVRLRLSAANAADQHQQHSALVRRLNQIHHQRFQIGKLKTNNETFSWFRKSHRPVHLTDGLGPYKFKHIPIPVFTFDQQNLVYKIVT